MIIRIVDEPIEKQTPKQVALTGSYSSLPSANGDLRVGKIRAIAQRIMSHQRSGTHVSSTFFVRTTIKPLDQKDRFFSNFYNQVFGNIDPTFLRQRQTDPLHSGVIEGISHGGKFRDIRFISVNNSSFWSSTTKINCRITKHLQMM